MTGRPIVQAIIEGRIVAIIRGEDSTHLGAAARTLVQEGITALEFPLTGPHVLDVISKTAVALDGAAVVGAGTVRTVSDARSAIAAGASFLVSPTLSVPVIEFAAGEGVPVLPGVFTPTEIDAALGAGAELVKLFPATALGPAYLRDVLVPLADACVVPTGGVRLEEAPEWLAAGAVALGVGSPLLDDAPQGGDLDGLRARAQAWLHQVRESNG
jgi:2-dehydro-3-deoxyphosphogluconate aldolase / (4S)-4-hydroxy-2-oxoglutarate aldolase